MKIALVALIAVFGYIWLVCKNYNFESGLVKHRGLSKRRKAAYGSWPDDKRSFAMFVAALIVAFSSFALLFADRPRQAKPAVENIALPLVATSRTMQPAPPATTTPSSGVIQPSTRLVSRRTAHLLPSANRRKIYVERAALTTPVLGDFDGLRDSSLVSAPDRTVPVAVTDSPNAGDASSASGQVHAGLRARLVRSASRFCRWSGRLVTARINPRKCKASASAQDGPT